jgi:hypothetical protein
VPHGALVTSYWKCTTSEITKSFHVSTIVFDVKMKMKIVRTQLLNKLQRNNIRIITAGLRLYFKQEDNGGSPTSAVETCADFVQLQSMKRTRQGTRDQFLQRH